MDAAEELDDVRHAGHEDEAADRPSDGLEVPEPVLPVEEEEAHEHPCSLGHVREPVEPLSAHGLRRHAEVRALELHERAPVERVNDDRELLDVGRHQRKVHGDALVVALPLAGPVVPAVHEGAAEVLEVLERDVPDHAVPPVEGGDGGVEVDVPLLRHVPADAHDDAALVALEPGVGAEEHVRPLGPDLHLELALVAAGPGALLDQQRQVELVLLAVDQVGRHGEDGLADRLLVAKVVLVVHLELELGKLVGELGLELLVPLGVERLALGVRLDAVAEKPGARDLDEGVGALRDLVGDHEALGAHDVDVKLATFDGSTHFFLSFFFLCYYLFVKVCVCVCIKDLFVY